MNARRLTTTLLTGTMLATLPAFAFAQEAPTTVAAGSDTDGIEVIVTAQKRSQRLQDVPISIQVLGTKKLDDLNISNFNDFAAQLPSVSFQTSSPGSTKVYFRGVASGGDGNHSGSLPSVGIYLDEQPVTTIDGALDVHVYDIARIESLAGPQGTLYGASSEAGTLRIITNKPDMSGTFGRFDSEVNKVSDGGMGGQLEGMFNTPIGSKAALRIVGWYEHDAGYIDNIPGTRTFLGDPDGEGGYLPGITVNNAQFVKKDYNDTDIVGGRAALKVDLDDNWTTTATIIAQDTKSHGTYAYDKSLGDLQIQRFFPESGHDRFAQAALTVQGKIGNFDLTYAGAYMERKVNTQSDYTDYAEAYDALYASYGGMANYQYFTNETGDTIDPRQTIFGTDKFTKQSHEFRIASPTTDRLRFVAGAFYQYQTHDILQDYQVPNLSAAMSVNGWEGTLWLTKQSRIDRDAAIFGEVSFDITPKLTLTAGGRSFTYDNSLIGFFGFGRSEGFLAGTDAPNAVYGSSGVRRCFTTDTYGVDNPKDPTGTLLTEGGIAGTPCTDLGVQNADGSISPKHAKGSGFSPKVNLSWKATPALMLYGTYSKGFRPGGINRRASVPNYAPDYLSNFELGWKATLFNKTVHLNGALYDQKWESFQFAFLGQNSFTEIHNGPDADIKGLEMDLAWVPMQGLTIGASGALTNAKTTSNLCAFEGDTNADCSGIITTHETQYPDGVATDIYTDHQNSIAAPIGTRLPITPQVKLAANARYSWDIGKYSPFWQVDAAYQSGASTDIRVTEAAALGRLKGYTVINLAIGIEWDKWTLEAYLRNALNERAELSRFVQCSICYQRSYIVPNTPQTFGVRLGSSF